MVLGIERMKVGYMVNKRISTRLLALVLCLYAPTSLIGCTRQTSESSNQERIASLQHEKQLKARAHTGNMLYALKSEGSYKRTSIDWPTYNRNRYSTGARSIAKELGACTKIGLRRIFPRPEVHKVLWGKEKGFHDIVSQLRALLRKGVGITGNGPLELASTYELVLYVSNHTAYQARFTPQGRYLEINGKMKVEMVNGEEVFKSIEGSHLTVATDLPDEAIASLKSSLDSVLQAKDR